MKKTLVLQSFLQQKARQLKKEKSIRQNQAYDEAARSFGYSNYKEYLHDLKDKMRIKEILLLNIHSEKDMFKKIELAIAFLKNINIPFYEQLTILKLFQDAKKDHKKAYAKLNLNKDIHDLIDYPWLQLICEQLSFMKDEIKTHLFEDFRTGEGKEDIEDIAPNFIAKDISISDLMYRIEDDKLLIFEADYKVNLIFDFENIKLVSEDDYKDERFNDRQISGSFGVEIDRNKQITYLHSDIGLDNGFIPTTVFTEDEMESYYKRFPDERNQFDNMVLLDNSNFTNIKQCLANNERLTGKELEIALDLVDVLGDDEQSRFVRNIGIKMKAGEPLDEYEYHVLVDVLMLHQQLSS
ncbi:hypothetical protein SCP20_00445 [Legionella pneumophila serogroup 1]|uniref:hypothetical protein n=1 Tax=Legionella pneumophila TaxID=446 RepID=UPI000E013ED7|nr:hypothetical protein [Legionella pneumophila]HAT9211473.1 hypothetical protein [Legionella pneumophila subsp. pneumophila]STX88944.1 Uncharacterised protein [Legionella pneumophila]HAT9241909.1 hypothetical protein [Legionella pneumophila subsp. pneumophila]HAT9254444.1 hypothetical protein [Legionella pneumophila subsp. pneumophila]HAT9257124.1 hypothetical protein [Legionella pneumophila subsp. pneumophila]